MQKRLTLRPSIKAHQLQPITESDSRLHVEDSFQKEPFRCTNIALTRTVDSTVGVDQVAQRIEIVQIAVVVRSAETLSKFLQSLQPVDAGLRTVRLQNPDLLAADHAKRIARAARLTAGLVGHLDDAGHLVRTVDCQHRTLNVDRVQRYLVGRLFEALELECVRIEPDPTLLEAACGDAGFRGKIKCFGLV